MSTTTHLPNISVVVTLDPRPIQEAGFATIMLLVPLSANSLNGSRTMTFTTYEEAQTANTAGYISAGTLAAALASFSQRPQPEKFKVGYVDLVTSIAAVKAFKAFGGAGLGDTFDTVIEATVAGVAGNKIAVELVGDSAGAVTITSGVVSDLTFVVIHYQPGVSTVTNIETAITALAGAADIIGVKTGGTGATVLDADAGEMSPTLLAGGVDAVPVETYATGLAAVILVDPAFYGLAITPRTDAEIVLVSDTVEALSKRILFGFQSDDSSFKNSGVPSGLSTIDGNERTVAHYHTSDAVWMDVANLANRLVWDPDEQSVPWSGQPLRGVDAYATAPTASERTFIIDNMANLGLPYGGSDFVIDPGVNFNDRPVDEIISSDWFVTRLEERISALVVARANAGLKIPVSTEGQALILAEIEGLLDIGVAAGHFVDGQTLATAREITDSDLDDRKLRFRVRAQFAVSGRLFDVAVNFSRDPIADDA